MESVPQVMNLLPGTNERMDQHNLQIQSQRKLQGRMDLWRSAVELPVQRRITSQPVHFAWNFVHSYFESLNVQSFAYYSLLLGCGRLVDNPQSSPHPSSVAI